MIRPHHVIALYSIARQPDSGFPPKKAIIEVAMREDDETTILLPEGGRTATFKNHRPKYPIKVHIWAAISKKSATKA